MELRHCGRLVGTLARLSRQVTTLLLIHRRSLHTRFCRCISAARFLLRSKIFLSAQTESDPCISTRLQTIVIVAILEVVHGAHRSVASNQP